MKRRHPVFLWVLFVFFIAITHGAQAQKTPLQNNRGSVRLAVVTSGGFAESLRKIKPIYEEKTGVKISLSYGSSMGGAHDSIPLRLGRGEKFDAVIMVGSALDDLIEKHWLNGETKTDLAASTIGMAIKKGQPPIDISSEEKFVRVLKKAKRIGYSASASGTYLSTSLWPAMGIWDDIKHKAVRVKSKRVASLVASGDLDIGFQQVSEILPVEGVIFSGELPAAYQKITIYSAAVTQRSEYKQAVNDLIEYLSSKYVANIVKAEGLRPITALVRESEGKKTHW